MERAVLAATTAPAVDPAHAAQLQQLEDAILGFAQARPAKVDEALEVYEEIIDKGLEPTMPVFHALTMGCCSSRPQKLDEALMLFRQMGKQGLYPDSSLCNALIQGCSGYGRVDDAVTVLGRMLKGGSTPNNTSYKNLIDACAEAQPKALAQDAIAVYHMLRARHILPDQVTFNSLLNACSKARPSELTTALELRDSMKSMKLRLDTFSVPALLRCCAYAAEQRPARVAMEIFNDAMASGHVECNTHVQRALKQAVGAYRSEQLVIWAKKTKPWQTKKGGKTGTAGKASASTRSAAAHRGRRSVSSTRDRRDGDAGKRRREATEPTASAGRPRR